MTTSLIKICGINDPRALDAAIHARADYVGFVFFPPSPRHLSPPKAAELAARAGSAVPKVGLVVDAEDRTIAEAVTAGKLDALQLHGSESPGRAAQIRAHFGLPVWKALPVATAGDIEKSKAYEGAVDLILFDAKTPKGTLPGGMGLAFDWDLLSNYRGALPWGLAGGLNPGNVATAIRRTGAPLVDTSSGVESSPGIKDLDKIVAFCAAVRSAVP